MKSIFLSVVVLALIPNLARAASLSDLPVSSRPTVNQLIAIEEKAGGLSPKIGVAFEMLDQMFPDSQSKQKFLEQWLVDFTDVARETAVNFQLRTELPFDKYEALGVRGAMGGDGTWQTGRLTRDRRLAVLTDMSATFYVPAHYAMLKLTDSEWSQYKISYEKALDESQKELERSKRYMNEYNTMNVSQLANHASHLLLNFVLYREYFSLFASRPVVEIQKIKLRQMDLVEMVFNGPYLTQEQKNSVIDGVVDQFMRYQEGRDITFYENYLVFEPLLSRIQKLKSHLKRAPEGGYYSQPSIFAETSANFDRAVQRRIMTCEQLFR